MQRGFQLVHHLQRTRLGLWRIILLHKDLTQRFSQIAISCCYATLPTGLQLLGPLQCLSVEIEVFINKRLRQCLHLRMGQVPAQIRFKIIQADSL